jgi:NADP-dependent 3-hydroxy acid dehydrogenase YdfG
LNNLDRTGNLVSIDQNTDRVAVITGASSGIGEATAGAGSVAAERARRDGALPAHGQS